MGLLYLYLSGIYLKSTFTAIMLKSKPSGVLVINVLAVKVGIVYIYLYRTNTTDCKDINIKKPSWLD
jgi:hypothetical protein